MTVCCHLSREDAGRLLQNHRVKLLSYDDDDTRRITVRRKHILQDTLTALRIKPWVSSKHIQVTFVGEPGVDDGGPRREYFRLLLNSIARNNTYFTGSPERRLPLPNALATQDKVFFHIGQMLALSLMNDGPCASWLAPSCVSYLLGTEDTDDLPIEDIPDPDIRVKVNKVD